MSTYKDRTDVAQIARGDKGALKWLARAVPCKVVAADRAEAEKDGYTGVYTLNTDTIKILPFAQWDTLDQAHGLPWALVLLHEAVHATQLRLKRTPPITELQLIRFFDRGLFSVIQEREEAVAYLGAALLAPDLGFDGFKAWERYRMLVEGAPPEITKWVKHEAERAIDWLRRRAETVDKRPFDDDLKRWTEAA